MFPVVTARAVLWVPWYLHVRVLDSTGNATKVGFLLKILLHVRFTVVVDLEVAIMLRPGPIAIIRPPLLSCLCKNRVKVEKKQM